MSDVSALLAVVLGRNTPSLPQGGVSYGDWQGRHAQPVPPGAQLGLWVLRERAGSPEESVVEEGAGGGEAQTLRRSGGADTGLFFLVV